MSNQFCSNCGAQIPSDSKFCTSCGHEIHAAQPKQPHQTSTYQEPMNTTGNPPQKPNNNRRFILGAVAVIAIIAFFIFNKEDTPEQVAEKFVDHLSNFELAKVKDLLAHDADEYLKEEINWMLDEINSDPNVIKEAKEEQNEDGYKVKSFITTDVDEEEHYAYVYIELTYENGDTEVIDVDLLKENGQWKVEDSY